jgi:hypothetical protein
MMYNDFRLSVRELRQIRRNERKVNSITSPFHTTTPIIYDTEQESDLSEIEYSTKENTRRIKRSHEKKDKKCKIIDDDDTAATDVIEYSVSIKQDNTRNSRINSVRELAMKKHSADKHVTFEDQDKMPKPFRIPNGRYNFRKIKQHTKDKNEYLQETLYKKKPNSRMLRSQLKKNYYESDSENDEDYEEDVASFLYHTFVK